LDEIQSAIQAVYVNYFGQEDKKSYWFLVFKEKFENTKDEKAKVLALNDGFDELFPDVGLEASKLAEILEDLALLDPRPVGDRTPWPD